MSLPAFPVFAPLETSEPRPFWSVMIPCYDRTKYLERTLRSVLEQAPCAEEMQIEVVDNASPHSEIEDLVREVGGDRVRLFRQKSNLGVVGNWNSCIERARGQWVHILHDDDVVLPGFYKTYRQFIEAHPKAGLVLSRPITIDADDQWKHILYTKDRTHTGIWEDALFRLVSGSTSDYLRFPTIAVARRAYEEVGGFDPASIYTIDLQMWIRIAAAFPVGYVHQPLTLYREHTESITYQLVRDHDALADVERTLKLGLALLPASQRAEAECGVHQNCAVLAEMYRQYMFELGKHRAELKYSRHLYRHVPSRRNLLLVFKSWARALKSQVSKKATTKS